MKSNYIIAFAILSLIIVGVLYWLIYINRGNDSTTSLSLKVFGPILIAAFLLGWDLFNKPISKSANYEISIFTNLKDCNPLNLGKAYFNVYNKGIGYSEITTTYRFSNIKESYLGMVNSLDEDMKSKMSEPDNNKNKSLFKLNKITSASRHNSKLISLTLVNWLANIYNKNWTNENIKTIRFGGGQAFQSEYDKSEENSESKVDEIIKSLNVKLDRESTTQSKIITTPKSGKFEPIKLSLEDGKIVSEIKYSSKQIKSYKIKIIYNGYSHLERGRVVEALKKKASDFENIYAFHYLIKTSYETKLYNKWSPKTKAEIKWIENQIKMFEENLNWKKIEEELVYSLENVPEEIKIEL